MTTLGRHAIVVGNGIAGLLSAQVLSQYFNQVTILDRDSHGDEPYEPRNGVPQGFHAHLLLAGGGDAMERLLPGLRADLVAAGAEQCDAGEKIETYMPTGTLSRRTLGFEVVALSRPLLEGCVRQRVGKAAAVEFRLGFRVTGLRVDATGKRVVGVVGRALGEPGQAEETISADLVVDASGRSSKLAEWLPGIGFPKVPSVELDAGLTYTSCLYEKPAGSQDWLIRISAPVPSYNNRGSAVVEVENDRLLVSVISMKRDLPPTDHAGFAEFAKAVSDPMVAEITSSARPLSRVRRYANILIRRNDFHLMSRWPQGLLAIGDSVAAFDPVYGQGMSVAALQAQALRDILASAAERGDFAAVARKFQRQAARIVKWAWLMSGSLDWAWITGRVPLSARLAQRLMQRIYMVMPGNETVHRTFMRALHMVESPSVLVRPGFLTLLVKDMLKKR
jgi:2-polyprenyl-6-methoxyphenol hydroxylase-like FAD-dependent oxidoreductase